MRSISDIGRAIVVVAISFTAAPVAFAHPGTGIIVDGEGQVYFVHTGFGIWKIDGEGRLLRHEGPGFHFLEYDPDGHFIGQRWPRYREQFREGVIRYGDAEIRPVGTRPTLLCASSFPIAIGSDGALYYPDVGTEERVHMMRLAPSGRPSDYATLPLAMEVAPNGKLSKALWIHGLAAGADGSLYYTEKEAVRRIDPEGTVVLVADDMEIPDCVHSEDHRGGPILRGLDVAADGTLYVASMACGAVVRITAEGATDVALRSEDSWTPTGVAVRGDELYVLEFWFMDQERAEDWLPRVRKLSADGSVTVLATVTGVPE